MPKKVTYDFKGSKIPFSENWFGTLVIKPDFPVRIQTGKLGSKSHGINPFASTLLKRITAIYRSHLIAHNNIFC